MFTGDITIYMDFKIDTHCRGRHLLECKTSSILTLNDFSTLMNIPLCGLSFINSKTNKRAIFAYKQTAGQKVTFQKINPKITIKQDEDGEKCKFWIFLQKSKYRNLEINLRCGYIIDIDTMYHDLMRSTKTFKQLMGQFDTRFQFYKIDNNGK